MIKNEHLFLHGVLVRKLDQRELQDFQIYQNNLDIHRQQILSKGFRYDIIIQGNPKVHGESLHNRYSTNWTIFKKYKVRQKHAIFFIRRLCKLSSGTFGLPCRYMKNKYLIQCFK